MKNDQDRPSLKDNITPKDNENVYGRALEAYQQRDLQSAERYCNEIFESDPEYPNSLHLLSAVELTRGQIKKALDLASRAAHLKPTDPTIQNGLALALDADGQMHEALVVFDLAVSLPPPMADVHANRCKLLSELDRLDEALIAADEALALNQDCISALYNKGVTFFKLGRIGDAIEYFDRVSVLKPFLPELLNMKITAYSYSPRHTAEDVFNVTKSYWSSVGDDPKRYPARARSSERERPFRIGYISADFRKHAVGILFRPFFEKRTTDQFHTTLYYNFAEEDELTRYYKTHSDAWRCVNGVGDGDVAAQIDQDGIDILVDLSGHTEGNRLGVLRHKPAPVQATWLGYFATTGVKEIDFIIADQYVLPESDEHLYVEKPMRLPESYFCFGSQEFMMRPTLQPRAETGQVRFGSFNNLLKVNTDVLRLWSDILQQVPGSLLFLKSHMLSKDSVWLSTEELCQEVGIPLDRLVLMGATSREEHMAAYGQIDIALDTFPYGGGTTTAEALWMGVPVVTLAGDRWVSRVGQSIIMTACLPQLVAHSKDEYVDIAVSLARNRAELNGLHHSLRNIFQSSPCCDANGFAKAVEAAYLKMWQMSQSN
jgi:protein O-GlcNAc transferase